MWEGAPCITIVLGEMQAKKKKKKKIEVVAVGMYDSELQGLLCMYLKSIISSEKSKYRIEHRAWYNFIFIF